VRKNLPRELKRHGHNIIPRNPHRHAHTEQSLEQVKTALNGYLQLFQCGVPNTLMGGSELNDKIASYAEQNVASAFAFARKLLEIRNPQDLFMLQTEFIREQMQAMTEQAKDLSETVTKSIMTGVKMPTQGGPSS